MAEITDIEDIVKDYAWNIYMKTSNGNRKVDYDEARFDIDWSRTKFVSSKPEFQKIDNNGQQVPRGKIPAQLAETPTSQEIYRSTYTNKTNGEQEHAISMHRSTKSTCKAYITKGYTKGINVGLKLAVPGDVANITPSFGYSVNITENSEETTEKTIDWGSDCKVKVPKGQKVSAKISVVEKNYSATFQMTTSIYGTVHVAIHSRSDDRFLQSIDTPFTNIMRWYSEKNGGYGQYTIKPKEVEWKVSGNCDFRFGVEQQVEIQPM
mmetsp:Transcript_29361/g.47099  ORF Transcript_29361/g.47099 Transcript_29361/m.47099 type:complete len:265 (+) Transcript_29361:51-845(+)|eukprot:CAMPEP_0203752976 /NCGR_PEP_ID=MMETSP0098-20131031/6825_1 /ASSEMBLY_ACC=CAM_ASM_000208 /TAXON_ID=96639 /ORGANISM=" , Strain NY0313808BC1" /LENGTH=264 /DNA_ID=CAMNT_0050643385 /DNA_START=26 /DNA_END=820 /DNA_ORIENTATION=-